MGFLWTKLALCLAFVSGIAGLEAGSSAFCYSFESSDPEWTQEGPLYWKWSGSALPQVSTIVPTFAAASNYTWLQDFVLAPNEGAMLSPDSFDLKVGDKIQASVFSYVAGGVSSGTAILRFKTGSDNQDLIKIPNLNAWTTVSVTCVDAPIDGTEAQCCPDTGYPCTGNFEVTGAVTDPTDLLAIDEISVNNGCDPSPGWCCTFEGDTCNWSPEFITNGWEWSTVKSNPDLDLLSADGDYVYIADTSANLTSSLLLNVPDSSTFKFSYYFDSAKYDADNRVQATFTDLTAEPNEIVYVTLYLNPTNDAFHSAEYSLSGLCHGASICEGVFQLTTFNAPGVPLTVGLDSFSLNGAC